MSIHINGEKLKHLHIAGDVILITDSVKNATILVSLEMISCQLGLQFI